jgi:Ni,Fe-hydrogenase III large subunit
MRSNYTEVIDQLAMVFNKLEHLEETELADKIKVVINELENIKSKLCSCGNLIHPDYDGYCADCG